MRRTGSSTRAWTSANGRKTCSPCREDGGGGAESGRETEGQLLAWAGLDKGEGCGCRGEDRIGGDADPRAIGRATARSPARAATASKRAQGAAEPPRPLVNHHSRHGRPRAPAAAAEGQAAQAVCKAPRSEAAPAATSRSVLVRLDGTSSNGIDHGGNHSASGSQWRCWRRWPASQAQARRPPSAAESARGRPLEDGRALGVGRDGRLARVPAGQAREGVGLSLFLSRFFAWGCRGRLSFLEEGPGELTRLHLSRTVRPRILSRRGRTSSSARTKPSRPFTGRSMGTSSGTSRVGYGLCGNGSTMTS